MICVLSTPLDLCVTLLSCCSPELKAVSAEGHRECRQCHCPRALASSEGGVLLLPCLPGGERKSIPMAGAMARLWVSPFCLPSSQSRLSSLCCSLCAVNQDLRYFWCCLSLGETPLLVELTVCAWVFPVISQLGEPPGEASRLVTGGAQPPLRAPHLQGEGSKAS